MATITITKTSNGGKLKDLNKEFKNATSAKDLDTVLNKVQKVDYTCCFTRCKNRTKDFSIDCKYCNGRFCPTHGLPEVHGCGEAVKRDEKRQFLHPQPKVPTENHEQAQSKLARKLKKMQLERKAKQGSSKNKQK